VRLCIAVTVTVEYDGPRPGIFRFPSFIANFRAWISIDRS
jgi:hypothetical protein